MSTVTTFGIAQLSRDSTELVLNLKISSGNEYLAAATSYGNICHLDPQTLQVIQKFQAHKQRIVDLEFIHPTAGTSSTSASSSSRSIGSFGPSIVFSAGQDGLAALWDLRLTCKGPALKIQSTNSYDTHAF
jgi:WD40 repeat protein